MEKRTIIAVVLSIFILMVFSYFSSQGPVQQPVEPQQKAWPAKTEEKKEEEKLSAQAEPPALISDPSAKEKEIKVETDLYSAVFTTKGGTLKKWELKEYNETEQTEQLPVSLMQPDMIIPPLSILLEGQLRDLPVKANYSVNKDSVLFDSYKNSDVLTFSYSDPSGLSIRKTFTLYKDSYRVDLVTEVKGVPSYEVALGSKFGIFDEQGTWVHVGPVLLKGSDRIETDKGNIEGINFIQRFIRKMSGTESKTEMLHRGNIFWIAQEDKYFASALVSTGREYDVRIWKQGNGSGNKTLGAEIAFRVTGEKGEFFLYAGPKKYDILKSFGVGLEHIIDFGFFSIIAQPLFWILQLFYKVLGNYGWAIILLTMVVRIPFIPLINKGQKSMKKLQTVQPMMAAIREKYKKDPQKMQKEIMGLYKQHKVNPMGGCLPMLIQLPVFFALYKILLISIELRDTPFIWWIKDLSAKDPYYVLPILMGLTMVIQQKMTPSAMDPKQAKMMMMLPIVFTFMFLSLPSGLVLYWLVSNLLGIAQQYYINKKVSV